MTETELTVGELTTSAQFPKAKPAPEPSSLPVQFTYFNSEDGIDENLLILLHGLGEYWSHCLSWHMDLLRSLEMKAILRNHSRTSLVNYVYLKRLLYL